MKTFQYFRKIPLLRLEHLYHFVRIDNELQRVADRTLALRWGYWHWFVTLPWTRRLL